MSKYDLIAPCGINCGVCIGYLREKNKCPGCITEGDDKPIHCQNCVIRNCQNKDDKYCFKCKAKYPCNRLKNLDKRYKTRYRTSLIQNLEDIKKNGIREFMRKEDIKWICSRCKGITSIHRTECLNCKEKYVVDLNFEDKNVNNR